MTRACPHDVVAGTCVHCLAEELEVETKIVEEIVGEVLYREAKRRALFVPLKRHDDECPWHGAAINYVDRCPACEARGAPKGCRFHADPT